MAVKIRLKRMGKIHAPYYRIVVADSRKKRDGRVIEEIGKYHPKSDPSFIEVDSERAQYWLGVGAQPTEPVAVLLKLTGDWQQYKGEPAPTEPLRMPAAKRDKTEAFNEALRDAHDEPKTEAVTRRKSRAADAPATDAPATKTAEPAGEVPAPNAVPADEAVPAEVSAGEVDTSVEVSAETVSEPSPDDAPVAEVATEPAAETPPADAAPSADVDDAPAADDESAQG